MSTLTSNLGLTKPGTSDAVSIATIDTNYDLIDAAIGVLTSSLAGKADESDLANCPSIIAGSYVGTGSGGVVLSFSHDVHAVIIVRDSDQACGWMWLGQAGNYASESSNGYSYNSSTHTLTLTNYYTDYRAWRCANGTGIRYYYVAF